MAHQTNSRPPSVCCRVWLQVAVVVLVAIPSNTRAEPLWDTIPFTTFRDMQAVKADGSPAWTIPVHGALAEQGYKLLGVVLNNPEDLLDTAANFIACAPGTQWQMGGQWQVFVQAVDADDFGGAALWMGQNYGNHIWHWPDSNYSYSNAQWEAEVARVSTDNTLRAGDVVEIRARGGLFYQGKFNVNEQHDTDAGLDFDVQILARDQMPAATAISLSDVKNPDDSFRFVADRQSGAEHYQSRLVRLEGVTLVDSAGWGPDAVLTITDGTLHLPMKLGRMGFDSVAAPTGPFSVVGILDQESPNYQAGYRLWVVDAGQFVVPEPGSMLLLACAATALLAAGRKRNRSVGKRQSPHAAP